MPLATTVVLFTVVFFIITRRLNIINVYFLRNYWFLFTPLLLSHLRGVHLVWFIWALILILLLNFKPLLKVVGIMYGGLDSLQHFVRWYIKKSGIAFWTLNPSLILFTLYRIAAMGTT